MKWLPAYCCAALILTGCQQESHPDGSASSEEGNSSIRFEKIPASHSGVDFNNSLDDSGNLNVFIWNFLYTGSGVATGDINGDGLPDIYFGGNQVPDRLYLNLGDFKFQDISAEAGIQDNTWTTGVTMADVNADGLLDIYVCKNSPTLNPNANRNKLFINQGNLRFSEQAAVYGLADEGLSIQASFFDADQDGDLDAYLINQPVDQLTQLIHPPEAVASYPVTDRFFLNEDGFFVDKTTEYGMEEDRYGLGISLADFDGNGWTDIYVCNDYTHADLLYLNDKGRFRDELRERTGHISYYSMGSDAGDINNDGWEDVLVLDMAFEDHYRAKTNMESMQPELFWSIVSEGHHYPYAQNTLQLNRGDGYFAEVAQMGGLSKTDWSWAALMMDFDADGFQDIAVTNGILRDMKNNDFTQWVGRTYQGRVGPSNYREVLARLPSNPVENKLYRNLGDLQFEDISAASGFGIPGFSQGLAYADFDGDGALDLVENNMNAVAGIYRNTSPQIGHVLILALKGPGSNTHGLGIPVLVCAGDTRIAMTMQTTRGYYSSSVPELYFGLGTHAVIDSIIITWNAEEQTVLTNVRTDQALRVSYDMTTTRPFVARSSSVYRLGEGRELPFTHRETSYDDYTTQVLLPYQLSQNGPFISSGDINGDDIQDLFIGGAAGQAGVTMLGAADGAFQLLNQPALVSDAAHEDQESVMFDLEGDGDLDLYVSSGSSEFAEGSQWLTHRLYRNDGSGRLTRDRAAIADMRPVNGQCVTAFDLEGDGDMDLFVGGRQVSEQYATPAESVLLINDRGTLRDATELVVPSGLKLGMVTDAVSADPDQDGDTDLLIVGEWMAPTFLINDNGKLTPRGLSDPGEGIWWTVESSDIDGDGDTDFVLGNLGWNNKFGGRTPKLSVYASDFDNNGDHDVVLAKQVGDIELPYRGRECSSEEMPFITSRFPTYDAFARAGLPEILGAEGLDRSVHVKVRTLSSVLLLNQGELRFEVIPLPAEVQTGPVKAMCTGDFNGDGHQDILYAGNHFPVEVETARYDGLLHGICFGDGQGGFKVRTLTSVDYPLMKDYRDMLVTNDNRLILTANDGPVVAYSLRAD